MLVIILLSVLGLIAYLSTGLIIARKHSDEIYLAANNIRRARLRRGCTKRYAQKGYRSEIRKYTLRVMFLWLPRYICVYIGSFFTAIDNKLFRFVTTPIDEKRKRAKQLEAAIDFWCTMINSEDEDPDTVVDAVTTVTLLKARLKELEKFR